MIAHLAQNTIGMLWFIFILFWLVTAFSAKRKVRTGWWKRETLLRLAIAACVVVIFLLLPAKNIGASYADSPAYGILAALGIFLVAAGLGYALWARMNLGRNWSGYPSVQENHELVTSGPYRTVRHPIYTGIILALAGSLMVGAVGWIVAFFTITPILLLRIPAEEKIMRGLFPNEYPAYMKRTKRLVPFIW
ncbi:MAG: isoprenylcysteine carboxylmethyltransferase family protein [Patescibacteria group bacterium]|nr:isoprenylcysteine carboxylmethyltransferase family protein [Patescibacteria group bacterium]MDE1945967.1 isoprenylcysteine carboxylmethyltransferase family protein [Patescibacteria group bacterium]